MKPIDRLLVIARPGRPSRGLILAGALRLNCALGRAGVRAGKREGDGATPAGRFRLGPLFYRADRAPRPRSGLPTRALRRDDGWCDAPADRNYNRPVRLPYPASCEAMWRDDALYDLVIDLAINRRPIRKGRGSAVFLHLARADFAPTAGCVALRRADLVRLLPRLRRTTTIEIRA